MGGWWTELSGVFGSFSLAVIGVYSSKSPAVMADGMTLSVFRLPSSVWLQRVVVQGRMRGWTHAQGPCSW